MVCELCLNKLFKKVDVCIGSIFHQHHLKKSYPYYQHILRKPKEIFLLKFSCLEHTQPSWRKIQFTLGNRDVETSLTGPIIPHVIEGTPQRRCYELNSVPTKGIEILTPSTCECDIIWKRGLYRGNQVK